MEWLYLILLLWFIAMAVKGQVAWTRELVSTIRAHREAKGRGRVAHIRRMRKANR